MKKADQLIDILDVRKVRWRKERQEYARSLIDRRRRQQRERAEPKPRLRAEPLYRIPGWQVMCARMQPGVWYTAPQVKALMAEFPQGSVRAWLWQKAPALGLVTRAGNPDFDGETDGRDMRGVMPVPIRYVYGLTAKGAAEAVEWRRALGMGSDTGD